MLLGSGAGQTTMSESGSRGPGFRLAPLAGGHRSTSAGNVQAGGGMFDSDPKVRRQKMESCYTFAEPAESRELFRKKVRQGMPSPPSHKFTPTVERQWAEWITEERKRIDERCERKWRKKFVDWRRDVLGKMENDSTSQGHSRRPSLNQSMRSRGQEVVGEDTLLLPSVQEAQPDPRHIEELEKLQAEIDQLRSERGQFLEEKEKMEHLLQCEKKERVSVFMKLAEVQEEKEAWMQKAQRREEKLRQITLEKKSMAKRLFEFGQTLRMIGLPAMRDSPLVDGVGEEQKEKRQKEERQRLSAAILIQRVERGRKARKQTHGRKKAAYDAERSVLDAAATKIQAAFRGRDTRKEVLPRKHTRPLEQYAEEDVAEVMQTFERRSSEFRARDKEEVRDRARHALHTALTQFLDAALEDTESVEETEDQSQVNARNAVDIAMNPSSIVSEVESETLVGSGDNMAQQTPEDVRKLISTKLAEATRSGALHNALHRIGSKEPPIEVTEDELNRFAVRVRDNLIEACKDGRLQAVLRRHRVLAGDYGEVINAQRKKARAASFKASARSALEQLLAQDEEEDEEAVQGEWQLVEETSAAKADAEEEENERFRAKARDALEMLLSAEEGEEEEEGLEDVNEATRARAQAALEMLLEQEDDVDEEEVEDAEAEIMKARAQRALEMLLEEDADTYEEDVEEEDETAATLKERSQTALEMLLEEDEFYAENDTVEGAESIAAKTRVQDAMSALRLSGEEDEYDADFEALQDDDEERTEEESQSEHARELVRAKMEEEVKPRFFEEEEEENSEGVIVPLGLEAMRQAVTSTLRSASKDGRLQAALEAVAPSRESPSNKLPPPPPRRVAPGGRPGSGMSEGSSLTGITAQVSNSEEGVELGCAPATQSVSAVALDVLRQVVGGAIVDEAPSDLG